MLNMIKMDLYRMFRTKSTYVVWIVLAVSVLFTTFLCKTDYDSLTEDEHRLFHELCRVNDRFSPYKEDFESCPNFFTTESDVKQKASEVFDCLCGKGE